MEIDISKMEFPLSSAQYPGLTTKGAHGWRRASIATQAEQDSSYPEQLVCNDSGLLGSVGG